jgi:hypothetical protein
MIRNNANKGIKSLLRKKTKNIKQAETNGFIDGAKHIPSFPEDIEFFKDANGYEVGRLQNARIVYSDYLERTQSFLTKINSRLKMIQHKVNISIPSRKKETEELHRSNIENLELLYGENPEGRKILILEKERLVKMFQNLQRQLGRPLQTSMNKLYLWLMALLAIVEVPINTFAFELFLEKQRMASILLAMAVGGILLFFAHVSGMLLKHTSSQHTEGRISKGIGLVIVSGFSIVVIYFLSKMRQAFVAIVSEAGSTISAADILATEGNMAAASKIWETPLGFDGYFLMTINLAIFLTGFIISFFHHDSHQDYEKINFESRRIEKNIKKDRAKHQEYLVKINKKHVRKLRNFSRNTDKLKSEEIMLIDIIESNAINSELAEMNVKIICNILAEEIHAYQDANAKSRLELDIPIPKYFSIPANENLSRLLVEK